MPDQTMTECVVCHLEVPLGKRTCVVCGADAGFPNDRMAGQKHEKQALGVRVNSAEVSASARDCKDELEQFGAAAGSSDAVIARSLATLHSLVSSDNVLMSTYHNQVRSGGRLPENNTWDAGRAAAESTIHPHYYQDICYAALSLDHIGVIGFGPYSITLREDHIAQRASVFEENCFHFCQRHAVIAGQPAPSGYRASWQERGLLAMAKLHSSVNPKMTETDFPAILLNQGSGGVDADFIEVHIFGDIDPRSFARVTGPAPSKGADKVIWRQCKKLLEAMGTEVVETA